MKAVSGVLKYFNKQKKVSVAEEEEFHQYKIMHNRLLQWRFANAKAEAAMANVKSKAEVCSIFFPLHLHDCINTCYTTFQYSMHVNDATLL